MTQLYVNIYLHCIVYLNLFQHILGSIILRTLWTFTVMFLKFIKVALKNYLSITIRVYCCMIMV